jgi:hypothetical protein
MAAIGKLFGEKILFRNGKNSNDPPSALKKRLQSIRRRFQTASPAPSQSDDFRSVDKGGIDLYSKADAFGTAHDAVFASEG